MSKRNDFVIKLCEYHAIKFRADYYVMTMLRDAIKTRKDCMACELDMPVNIHNDAIFFKEDES